jgi:integrase
MTVCLRAYGSRPATESCALADRRPLRSVEELMRGHRDGGAAADGRDGSADKVADQARAGGDDRNDRPPQREPLWCPGRGGTGRLAPEKLGNYWRARYKIGPGKYGTVRDAAGLVIRFRSRREAEKAANEAEAQPRQAARRAAAGRTTFGEYASQWYAGQDLAASTMQNYRRHIEEHLLPTFEHEPIDTIAASAVADWERQEIAAGYKRSSVKTWRGTLHLILADAVEDGLRESNPAARRRGRGRRDRSTRGRGPEKAVTTALGMLLIAERAALLSGRDDEFVAVTLMGYTGIRWAELVGLEPEYIRPGAVRVEWQLYELDTGELLRCPPRDGSYRTIDSPDWLSGLVTDHVARTRPRPCSCHGRAYVLRGFAAANGAVRQAGAKVVDDRDGVGRSQPTRVCAGRHSIEG